MIWNYNLISALILQLLITTNIYIYVYLIIFRSFHIRIYQGEYEPSKNHPRTIIVKPRHLRKQRAASQIHLDSELERKPRIFQEQTYDSKDPRSC